MTTIAWDGTTLAADKRCTIGGVQHTISKIRRGKTGNLVGYAGNCTLGERVLSALCEGAEWPDAQADKHDFCAVMEITPDGQCLKHERFGSFIVEDECFAIGSGADFALMAMHLGKSASEAVELASRFDTASGNGVDTLTLMPETPKRRSPARRRR